MCSESSADHVRSCSVPDNATHWARSPPRSAPAPWSAPTPASGRTREFAELVDLLQTPASRSRRSPTCCRTCPCTAEECAELAAGLDPDVVIGMGGGSCLDLAKAVAVLLAHGGQPPDYYGEFRVPARRCRSSRFPRPRGPVRRSRPVAVLTDPERVSKVGISSPHLIPHTAICDPELTFGCPPALTASAGADALSHVDRGVHGDPPAGVGRPRHRARLRRQERAHRPLRAARRPAHRQQPAPGLVRPRTTSRRARR